MMTPSSIADLLQPYLGDASAPPPRLYEQLAVYLQILMKWNARTNLTALRSPEEIVHRHFGESLFAGRHLPACGTLLDFGSGAGFPGLPIQLLYPSLSVTLAESQNKKASFLREIIRTLQLPTHVWAARVELMPAGTSFDTVTLRAVDSMGEALALAAPRALQHLVLLTTISAPLETLANFTVLDDLPVPRSNLSRLIVGQRIVGQRTTTVSCK